MNTLVQADIFFFISSIGFILLFVGGVVAWLYVIAVLRSVKRISQKIEDTVGDVSEEARAFVRDVRGSAPYRMFFGHKKSK